MNILSDLIAGVTWTWSRPDTVNRSAYTGARKIVGNPWHGQWKAHVDLAKVQGEAGIRALRSFMAQRKGQIVTFQLQATANAQNANSGETVSANAAQGATSLTVAGLATPLSDGQLFTVANQLCCCTANQSGSTLTFQPPLRKAVSSGTALVTSEPYALMFMSASALGWAVSQHRLFGISFDCEEAVTDADAPYSEIGTLGNSTAGAFYNASPDEKGGIDITVPAGGVWAKRLTVLVNTTNGRSDSIMKPVVFSGGGTGNPTASVLVMDGLPKTLPNIASNTSVDLWFNAGHTAQFFPAGHYFIGYHCAANSANVKLVAQGAVSTWFHADTYADGTASPFGAFSSAGSEIANFAMPYSLTGP